MELDLVFEKALLYDGSGRLPYTADLGVTGGLVSAIGNLASASAKMRVAAARLALCPGFIDVHSHADLALRLDDYPGVVEPLVRQGITTFVGGNCGVALGPVSRTNASHQFDFYDLFIGRDMRRALTWTSFGEMLDALEKQGVVQNCAILAPHAILRMDAMGDSTALAGADELACMKKLLAECLEAGAAGLSTGLMYFPGLCSDSRELLELGRVVHDFGGVFTSHLRSYNSDTLDQAMDEILEIGRVAEIPVQLSHMFWVPNFREPFSTLMKTAAKLASRLYQVRPFPVPVDSALKSHVERAGRLIEKGYPIGLDAMPTSAGFTHLFAFFPPWSLEGGMRKILERIANPQTRAQIRKSIEEGRPVWPHRGPDSWSMNMFKTMGWDCASVMNVFTAKNKPLEGKSFTQIGKETGKHPFDAACDLALEENGRVLIFETLTYPGDPVMELSIQGAIVDPNVSVVTDSITLGLGHPSHLFYDCYPKFLGQYSRDKKLLSLSEAIRKCTSLPASQLQIQNRGLIRPGYCADLVLFDPAGIGSNSTAQDPAHFPSGIHAVYVNGRAVVDEKGFHPEPRPGRILRHGR